MTSGFESAINEAMAELEKQRGELVRLSQGFNEITGEARSKRRQVSATVDARGDVVGLTFHGTGYRNLPPAELASVIVDTIRTARAAAQDRLWEELGDVMPEGAEWAEGMSETDWSKSIGESLALPQSLMDLLPGPQKDLFGQVFGRPSEDDTDNPHSTDGRASR
jgi:hypothetical protein